MASDPPNTGAAFTYSLELDVIVGSISAAGSRGQFAFELLAVGRTELWSELAALLAVRVFMVGERGSVSGKLKRANYAMGRNVRRSPGRGLVMCKRPRSPILKVLAKKWEVCGRGSGS